MMVTGTLTLKALNTKLQAKALDLHPPRTRDGQGLGSKGQGLWSQVLDEGDFFTIGITANRGCYMLCKGYKYTY